MTSELKSANSAWMRPDTWLPTSTVTTADRLPEVLTRETTSPRSAAAVWNCGAGSLRPAKRQASSAPSTTTRPRIQGRRWRRRDGESVDGM